MKLLLAQTAETRRQALEFAGAPGGWWRLAALLAVLSIVLGVFWLYRRETRVGASLRLRMRLATLRCLVLGILALVLLNPVWATYTRHTTEATLIVLVDDSASMGIRDGSTGPVRQSRAERVERFLNGPQAASSGLGSAGEGWLRRLGARNRVALFSFGERAARLPLPWDPPAAPASEPSPAEIPGQQGHSDVSAGLAQALRECSGGPIAGVVILSDGAFNQGAPAARSAEMAARERVPIYAIGVGSTDEPANVAVSSLSAPSLVARDDPFELTVDIQATQVEPMDLQLSVVARRVDEPEEQRVVTQQSVRVEAGAQTKVALKADAGGEFVYQARLEALPDELMTLDNAREVAVRVLDERLKVLLVSGRPSYDFRAVQRLLLRDKTIELSTWLQSADADAVREGSPPITELPRKPEELFGYDAILLMDPDPRGLDTNWSVLLRRWVDELGGGLLLAAGPANSARLMRDERLTDVTAILPILPDREADLRLGGQGAFRTRMQAISIPAEGAAHPVLRLAGELSETTRQWESLPGVWWSFPVQGEKPLASVLMRTGASEGPRGILLATQSLGAGRTAFLGFDGTWRWRGKAEKQFERFWVQMVRFLSQTRRQGASKRGAIVLDRDAPTIGEFVKVQAHVLDEKYQPTVAATVQLTIAPTGQPAREVALAAIAGRDGWYAGTVRFDAGGITTLRVALDSTSASTQPACLSRQVLVQSNQVEFEKLSQDEKQLRELAEVSSGKYLPIDQAGDLPEQIESAAVSRVTRGQSIPIWDRGWLMGLVAAALGAEWWLRRRRHLL